MSETKHVRYTGPEEQVTLVALDPPVHADRGVAVEVPADLLLGPGWEDVEPDGPAEPVDPAGEPAPDAPVPDAPTAPTTDGEAL